MHGQSELTPATTPTCMQCSRSRLYIYIEDLRCGSHLNQSTLCLLCSPLSLRLSRRITHARIVNNLSAPLLLVLVACAAATAAATTPAARFWEENLPGTPMPPTIAELVKKGTDHSLLKQRSSTSPQVVYQPDWCLGYSYRISCSPSSAASAAVASLSSSSSSSSTTSSSASATGVFFRHENIAVGSVMTVHFPPAVDLPAILPRAAAANAPFADATAVLSTFAVPRGSAEESMVLSTVTACTAPPLAGERKACATSLEAAVLAAARMLGVTSTARMMSVAASALTTRVGLPRQEYEVVAVAPIAGRHVTCHDDPFPYAVYRCHMEEKAATTEAYVLTLRGRELDQNGIGGRAPVVVDVDMVAVCHLDTSNWSPVHPAFQKLNLRPGGAPVCHFMPYADLLFSEKPATNA